MENDQKGKRGGAWLAQLEGKVTPDLRTVSSIPTMGIEITKKK